MKMTENLIMNLTPHSRKIAIKKKASHPSSTREPDLNFRKLVDKASWNHNETRGNRTTKTSVCERCSYNNLTY